MNLIRFTDAAVFQERIAPLLGKDEVVHNLILGIASRLVEMPDVHTRPAYMAVVEQEGVLQVAALMTPPRDLLLACVEEPEEAGLGLVVQDLVAANWTVPGVNGRDGCAEKFARTWSALTGESHDIHMALRLFDLRQVIPPRPASGFLRLATEEDLELIVRWTEAFMGEAEGRTGDDTVRKLSAHRIHEGDIYLWEDGEVVSMAMVVRSSADGAVVGGVYTPPSLRGRGYASSCVAGLSQAQLDAGKNYCALFTDLSNSTSNHIYQEIGYRPVCDFKHFRFTKQEVRAG